MLQEASRRGCMVGVSHSKLKLEIIRKCMHVCLDAGRQVILFIWSDSQPFKGVSTQLGQGCVCNFSGLELINETASQGCSHMEKNCPHKFSGMPGLAFFGYFCFALF